MKKQDLILRDLEYMITQCIFAPGDRLPATRSLCKQYDVSVSPVTAAYNALIARGWVESHPRSGYYVSEAVLEESEVRERSQYLHGNSSERYELLETIQSGLGRSFNMKNNISLNLGSTTAALSYYACENFTQHMIHALRSTPHSITNMQTTMHDLLDLKKEVLKWTKFRGLDLDIDTLSIVRSVSEGIILSLRACAEPGSIVAVESPGHAGFYFSTSLLNYQVMPVRSDPATGLDIEHFERMLRRGSIPSCLLLCSTFSNPTGAVMPDESKRRLTDLCARYAVPIIEDDIMGDLHYGKARPMPLKSFDRENVLYISGFGKSLSPMFRVGYVSAGKFSERFAFYKHLMVAYTLYPVQIGMAEFLRQGNAHEYVRLLRRRLSLLNENYREMISRYFPDGTTISNPKGGLYLWVTLPRNVDSDLLSNLAENYGISISPSRFFGAPASMKSAFRINIAAVPWSDEVCAALKTLGQLARSLASQGLHDK